MDKYLACLFILCFYNVLNRGVVGSTMRDWQFRGTLAESTTDRSEVPLPEGVVNCADSTNYQDSSHIQTCVDLGLCVGEGWFSKITRNPDDRWDEDYFVDAQQICKDQGYSDIGSEYGGNSGYQCKHPGSAGQFKPSTINHLGLTVSWGCKPPCTKTDGNAGDGTTQGTCSLDTDRCQSTGACIEPTSSCDDEIMNGDEEGVDCGGSCNQCLCRYISKSACQEEYARNACPTLCQELLDN